MRIWLMKVLQQSLGETQSNKSRHLVQSCPERNISVTELQRITKFSVKKVNRGKIIDMPCWYKTWQHSGYNHTRAKKIFPGDPEEPNEVPGADEETRNTDNSSEVGKSCADLSWNHCSSTPYRSETNGIAERAVRR